MSQLKVKWMAFLKSLLNLDQVQVPRSLWPADDCKGPPILIVFSDGSISAFGAAAYARWELLNGDFSSSLIMAKSKIAPKRIVSVPRMVLCGAVLSNRLKNYLLKVTNLIFEHTAQGLDTKFDLGRFAKKAQSMVFYQFFRESIFA